MAQAQLPDVDTLLIPIHTLGNDTTEHFFDASHLVGIGQSTISRVVNYLSPER